MIEKQAQVNFFVKFANGLLPHKSFSDIVDAGLGSVGVQWRNELCLVQPFPQLLVTCALGFSARCSSWRRLTWLLRLLAAF
jgi:hypothetical protein